MKINKKNKVVSGNKISRTVVFLLVVIFAWTGLSQANLSGLNIFQDNDQDGLTNEEERAYGTNPDKADTDGDGYSDRVEIESGYNPLKPAPGDKLIKEEPKIKGENDKKVSSEANLTDAFFEKIEQEKKQELDFLQTLTNNPQALENEELLNSFQGVSLTNEDIEKYFQEASQEVSLSDELELISEDEIEIIAKPTGSDEKIKEDEKKQIEEYLTAIFYIGATSSPFPLDENKDLTSQGISFIQIVSGYFENGEQEKIEELKIEAENVYEQVKKIKTPEVLKDIHISSLSILKYLKENVDEDDLLNQDDPLKMISALGKIQAALIEAENLKSELEAVLNEYEINSVGVLSDLEEDEDEEETN